jgi:hypothetical protein
MMKTTWKTGLVLLVGITMGMSAAVEAPAALLLDTFDTANSEDINSDLAGRQSGSAAPKSWTIDRPNKVGTGSFTQVRGDNFGEGLDNTLWLRAETAGANFGQTVVGMDLSWVPGNNFSVAFDMKKGINEDAGNHVGFGMRSVPDTDQIVQWADDSGLLFSVRDNGDYLYHEVGGSVVQVPGPLGKDGNGFYNVSFDVDRAGDAINNLTIGGSNLGTYNLPALAGRSDNIFFLVSLTGGAPEHAGIDNFKIVPEPSVMMLLGLGGAFLLRVRRARRA